MKQIALVLSLLLVALYAGCWTEDHSVKPVSSMPSMAASQPESMPALAVPNSVPVPQPVALLLPKAIKLDPFTGSRILNDEGKIAGLEVRVEAIDYFADATKAFGNFRFELYRYEQSKPDARGERLAVWNANLEEPAENKKHWQSIMRRYQFRLAWNEGIPVGRKFIVSVTYGSPYSPRLFDQRVFIAGQ